ncbi:HpcH/HpaI aldolase family protein [Pseudonocardia sp. TRM90224]|uniref:HpcH/HpaI aldolase family protein n=1 Tax=Pseudonocardia sp. TRM90224 TaxID=2812678 RepID=UPI001E44343B|nr:aldolase/citrate lyase family protein [Pseudonocardia sp. TRM90224]
MIDSSPLDLTSNAVGGWLHAPSSVTAEVVGSVGFDFVVIDQQHGLVGDDALVPMLQALGATGTPGVVRATVNEHAAIGRVLDRGAAGVIVPLVDSAEEAARAAAACRYPPAGTRSWGKSRVAWHPAAPDPLCIVMVETMAAVDGLPSILDVDGVDAIFVGPTDLALSAGVPITARDDDPAFIERLGSIAQRCAAAGRPVGIYCATAEQVHRSRELGFTFAAGFTETALLRAAAADIRAATV